MIAGRPIVPRSSWMTSNCSAAYQQQNEIIQRAAVGVVGKDAATRQ
jgi:hypothetical protein